MGMDEMYCKLNALLFLIKQSRNEYVNVFIVAAGGFITKTSGEMYAIPSVVSFNRNEIEAEAVDAVTRRNPPVILLTI
jgi:hypothetical protein